jgi:hypothetical protein
MTRSVQHWAQSSFLAPDKLHEKLSFPKVNPTWLLPPIPPPPDTHPWHHTLSAFLLLLHFCCPHPHWLWRNTPVVCPEVSTHSKSWKLLQGAGGWRDLAVNSLCNGISLWQGLSPVWNLASLASQLLVMLSFPLNATCPAAQLSTAPITLTQASCPTPGEMGKGSVIPTLQRRKLRLGNTKKNMAESTPKARLLLLCLCCYGILKKCSIKDQRIRGDHFAT